MSRDRSDSVPVEFPNMVSEQSILDDFDEWRTQREHARRARAISVPPVQPFIELEQPPLDPFAVWGVGYNGVLGASVPVEQQPSDVFSSSSHQSATPSELVSPYSHMTVSSAFNYPQKCSFCNKITYPPHTKRNCPTLLALPPCKLCGASGGSNHTITYCPSRKAVRLQLKDEFVSIPNYWERVKFRRLLKMREIQEELERHLHDSAHSGHLEALRAVINPRRMQQPLGITPPF